MTARYPRPLLGFLAVSLLLLAACQPATSPSLNGPDAPVDTAPEPVITVLGKPYILAELEALEQVTTTVGDRTATGVSLLALLDDAGVAADTVELVASDGYAASVPVADLDDTAVLGYVDGALDALIPTVARSAWVRDVVAITGPAAPEPAGGAPAGTDPIALDEPLVLTDAAGRTVTLDTLPGRIAVVGPGTHMPLHILYMFDEGRERLIAAEARGATPSDFLPMVDPRFDDVPSLAANPNVEQIAAMNPDLVIIKSVVEEATATNLAQAGIPVLYVDLETMDAFVDDARSIGALLGNPARAEEIVTYYQERLTAIDEALDGVDERPEVLLISYSERGGEAAVQVPAAAWMQTAQVERAGGDPIWLGAAAPTDGWTVTNLEQIAAWNPEMIFVVINQNLDAQAVIDGLKADANWGALRAVQEGQLYAFPQDIYGWDQPEPRWILGVRWLATRLHPNLFGDGAPHAIDMDAEMRAWFRELYGMDDAAFETHILPRLSMDID